MRSISSPRAGSNFSTPFKKIEGGTGQSSAAQALASIEAVPLSAVDQANGIAGLDENGKLSINAIPSESIPTISLQGEKDVVRGQTVNLLLTNYDSFTDYKLSTVNGSATRFRDTISFTAGNTIGPAKLSVNGLTFDLDVTDYRPKTPVLTAVDGIGVNSTAVAYLQTSAFEMLAVSDTHLNTDWQVATDPAFSNIVYQSLADAANKTLITVPALSLSTTYYFRSRHRPSTYSVSSWSQTSMFTTRANYNISTEEAKVAGTDRASADLSGYSVACSSDGNRVVIGVPQADPDTLSSAGAAYVFVRVGTSWSQEQKLIANDRAANNFFGRAVCINNTGDRLAISAPGNNSGATSKGAVYVWVRTSGVWSLEQKVSASDGAASDFMGDLGAIAIDSTGLRLVVGVRNNDHSSLSNPGAAYVFLRNGATWTQEAKLISPTPGTNFYFATSVDISDDGSRIIIGSSGATYNEPGYGEQVYLTPGTYTFTVPAGVFSLSMIGISAGGGAIIYGNGDQQAGGGGSVSYKNNFPVQPGDQFTVVVGAGGVAGGGVGGNTTITKVGGGLTISCPGGNGNGQGSSSPTGGDVNLPGSAGTYSTDLIVSPPASNTGYIFMGGGGLALYTAIAPNQAPTEQSGGAAGPGLYTFNGVTYTVYQSNDGGSFSASIYGSNQTTARVGYGGTIGYTNATQEFYALGGANGGVRFVWGTGKTYPTQATGTSSQGIVNVFERSGFTWSHSAEVKPNVPVTSAQFGYAVSLSGDGNRIAVGSPQNVEGSGRGIVYLFNRVANSWTQSEILTGSLRSNNDQMGYSVSLNNVGNVLAIGEPGSTFSSLAAAGAAYIYSFNGTTWNLDVKLTASDAIASGSFGNSVDLSDSANRLVVGSTGSRFGGTVMGAGYIFR